MKIKNVLIASTFALMSVAILAGCKNKETSIDIKVTNLVNKSFENVEIQLVNEGGKIEKKFTTKSNGVASIKFGKNYSVKLNNLPKGYYQDKEFNISLDSSSFDIKVPSKVIMEEAPDGTVYGIGDVIYDFEMIDCYGNNYKVSEILKQKDMIFVNYWATWCGPCLAEFPYMELAYEQYSDSVEILAMSNSDTNKKIQGLKETWVGSQENADRELTFPMGFDEYDTYANFGVTGFPTSIVIDRYGMVTTIEKGNLASTDDFIEIFDRFVGDNYNPILAEEDGKFYDKPTVDMPDSREIEAIINGEGFTSSYHDEENPADAEKNWPWIISEDRQSIHPSNAKKANTFSIIYTSVTLKNNEVFAFDYKADTEANHDILYVLIDRKIYQEISGHNNDWETCYCYTTLDESEHEVAFCYIKDSAANASVDTVYIKNLRIIPTSRINKPTLIYNDAYYGYSESLHTYLHYVDTVYNEDDGYYHVFDKNGPYLLANVQESSGFSNISILEYLGIGHVEDIDAAYRNQIGKYANMILQYASYQNNSEVGLVPVTEELKLALIDIMKAISNNGENEWMEVCGFIQAYGRDQIDDPIKGLAPFSAFEGRVGENFVEYNRLIMPRGLYTRFVPEHSGVYLFRSFSPNEQYVYETIGWLFDENMHLIEESDFGERYYMMVTKEDPNAHVYSYLEAGKTYYINMAFANLNVFGILPFMIEDLGVDELSILTLASPNFYTSTLDAEGNMLDTIAGGIDVKLGSDGYYHELRKDGSLGSIMYADFEYPTGLLQDYRGNALSIIDLINNGAFDFSVDDEGNPTSEVNKTEEARGYISQMIETGELKGMVPVTEGLANLLQGLIDKYSFKGVDHAWTKFCYYYKTYSANK